MVDALDLQPNLPHQLLQFRLESFFLRRFAGASTERHALGDGQAGDVHALRHHVLWGVRAGFSLYYLPLNQSLSGRFCIPHAFLRMPPGP